MPDNSSIITLLIFILVIVFIGEVFTEENIRIASFKQRQELLLSTDDESQVKSKDSLHVNKKEVPQDLHTVSIRYQNGGLKEQGGIYRDQNGKNIRHGKWSFWAENGKKIAEEHYRHGKPVSTWIYWDKEGKIIEMRNY